ncbi:cytochrome P450 [[Mycobacterium] wendilense]|uniref:Cytochrome P450 n=1 Tax=[Mycobacterium] wendilense TaxID=3064284 RepID=A0ABM9MJN8_9MYCO|nr:cytochrome P450 [Mycolicibacterium sp. MU0050]CAJ1586850.1 cytochrome P450 [Mycolicibacterium sp. MU0050]
MTTQQPDIDIADMLDPAAFERGYPHHVWTELRHSSPVHRCEPEGFTPFWAVTRHADIKTISTNPQLFSSTGMLDIAPKTSRVRDIPVELQPPTVLNTDPPLHREFRNLAQPYFRPRVLAELEQRVRDVTRDLLDGLAGRRDFDFVDDFVAWHPLRMISELLGIPREDEEIVLHMTNSALAVDDPEFSTETAVGSQTPDESNPMSGTRWEIFLPYLLDLVGKRRAKPTEDLASIIANGEINGEPLDDMVAVVYLLIIATAGHDTTRNALAGGMLALLDNPDQLDLLRNAPSLIKSATREIVRWSTPVAHFVRTATDDCELNGRRIRKGDPLALYYPSGNRDESVFDDPFTFRVDRDPNPHLGFGIGEHFCMGSALAQMEISVLLEEMIPRLRTVELAGEPQRIRTTHIGGVKHLPVRWQLDAATGS